MNTTVDKLKNFEGDLIAEVEFLRKREADALLLLHAAFGEYACSLKPGMSDRRIFEFENNFAVPARQFIGAKRFGR